MCYYHSLLDGDVPFAALYILNHTRLAVVPVLPCPSVKTVTCKLCVWLCWNTKCGPVLLSVQGGGHTLGLFLDDDHLLCLFFHAMWCGLGYCRTLQRMQLLFTIDCSVRIMEKQKPL